MILSGQGMFYRGGEIGFVLKEFLDFEEVVKSWEFILVRRNGLSKCSKYELIGLERF